MLIVALLIAAAPTRVFVAPVEATNVEPAVASLLSDRVVVAARRYPERFEVLSADDVQNALDVEAQRQAMGCDTVSCAAEIADALNAPFVVTGRLGHVGETWQLTLSLVDRQSLRAVRSETIDAKGKTPEGLLGAIPDQVDRLLATASSSGDAPSAALPLPMLTTASGAVVLGLGAIAYGASWLLYWQAEDAINKGDDDAQATLETNQAWGQPAAVVGVAMVAIGGVVAIAGATWWGASALVSE